MGQPRKNLRTYIPGPSRAYGPVLVVTSKWKWSPVSEVANPPSTKSTKGGGELIFYFILLNLIDLLGAHLTSFVLFLRFFFFW
jgi:hypothetical protein